MHYHHHRALVQLIIKGTGRVKAGDKTDVEAVKPAAKRYNALLKPQNLRRLKLMAVLQERRASTVLNDLCEQAVKGKRLPSAADLTKVEPGPGRPRKADRAAEPRKGATERFGAYLKGDTLLKLKLMAHARGVTPSTIMDELIEAAAQAYE